MKKVFLGLLLVIVVGGVYWFVTNFKNQNNLSSEGKIQACPETINKPGVYVDYSGRGEIPPAPETYIIYNGEKRSGSDFDLEWIEKNCQGKTKTMRAI